MFSMSLFPGGQHAGEHKILNFLFKTSSWMHLPGAFTVSDLLDFELSEHKIAKTKPSVVPYSAVALVH